MILIGKQVPYYQFKNLNQFSSRITHFISTRNFNGSNQFTIGLNGAVENSEVLKNRKQLARQLSIPPDAYVFASQVHGKGVAIVSSADRGKGAFDRASYLPGVDAMVTNQPEICIVAQAADCVPILFYDPVKNVVASAHAGWKGTVAKISGEVIKAFKKCYSSKPEDIIVGIGPSIGPCCYEVGCEVVNQVKETFGNIDGIILQSTKSAKPAFDLWETNYRILIEGGVKPQNIEVAKICTKCNNSEFFSARAGDQGRFGGFIMLLES